MTPIQITLIVVAFFALAFIIAIPLIIQRIESKKQKKAHAEMSSLSEEEQEFIDEYYN